MTESSVAARLIPPEAFVGTYSGHGDLDPWLVVRRYREVRLMWEASESPSTRRIAKQTGTERSLVEEFVTRKPSVVRDLEIARRHDWISIEPTSMVFRGLNVLVASIFGAGTIDPNSYEPRFRINSVRDINRIAWAIDRVGLQYSMYRETEQDRAQEIRPTKHAPVLGRVLVVLNAPIHGSADRIETLPEYLTVVSRDHRLAFARSYLDACIESTPERGTVTIRENRTNEFVDELVTFLAEVAGADVTRRDNEVVVSADAAHVLGAVS